MHTCDKTKGSANQSPRKPDFCSCTLVWTRCTCKIFELIYLRFFDNLDIFYLIITIIWFFDHWYIFFIYLYNFLPPPAKRVQYPNEALLFCRLNLPIAPALSASVSHSSTSSQCATNAAKARNHWTRIGMRWVSSPEHQSWAIDQHVAALPQCLAFQTFPTYYIVFAASQPLRVSFDVLVLYVFGLSWSFKIFM